MRIPALAIVVLLAGCAQLPPLPDGRATVATAPAEKGALAENIRRAEAAHPGQSGFRLLSDGSEAFLIRMQSARLATQSLDVQTYIWHADLTGAYLGQVLLDAADRGVRVRLLVDDLDARAKNDGFAALAAHPNIDVRLFNPWATRKGKLSQAGEGALNFDRINRRMHNKSWIADNRIAVAGGRNVGDEYFGAGEEVNFVDLDFVMLGPVVRDVSETFDRFWNSASAYPMEILDPEGVDEAALMRLRNRLAERAAEASESRYANALRGENLVQRMAAGEWPVRWSSSYRFVSDDPEKVSMKKRDVKRTHVGVTLVPMLQAARERVAIISPYFVPGDEVTAAFTRMAGGGKSVRILTNSLVANDVAAVHGGYSRHRKALLKGGVQLWEMKPGGGAGGASVFGSSGASLHTKAFVVDGEKLFVGSYNLDPRSTWLNCEQGVLVEDAVLARELETIFERQIGGSHAWRVTLGEGGLRWSDGVESFDSDPDASAWQRFQAWATRVLHLDAQL
ncbi:MAG TPA: phospholipase D family protein [Steroidobacteraceae bacterium]|nr:phospholipase D family protein [Steroidobacteraceae bacterium]